MRIFKRSLAVVLAVATVLTLSACHPKDEVAVTVKDTKSGISTTLTTAQYIYAYTNAVLEANSNIDENKKDADKEISDYTKYKVTETDEDGKEKKVAYEKWVDERAEELIRNYAAAMIKQKALKIKIDETTQQTIDSYSQMYWQYYYQPVFEKNGVGYETYKKMFTSSYYENEYFLSIYDKDGTDEVPEKTVSKTFYDSYCLADAIVISVKTEDAEAAEGEEATEESTLPTLDEAKKTLKDYKTRLEKGESFKTIYEEYNKATASEDEESTGTAESATVYGSEETDSASEYFTDIYKLKKGDIKIFTAEDESEVILVQKLDISSDEEKYYKSYRENVLHQLKDEDFQKKFEKFAKSLELTKDSYATKRVKIKKIDVATETAE